jgi:hypothetical protein
MVLDVNCPPVISFWILLSYFPEINGGQTHVDEGVIQCWDVPVIYFFNIGFLLPSLCDFMFVAVGYLSFVSHETTGNRETVHKSLLYWM